MAAEIVLGGSEGYRPKQVPTVTIDVHGKVYTARQPKNTVPLLVAEVQEKFSGLSERADGDMSGVLLEMRQSVRLLLRAMFSEKDTEDVLRRLADPAEERMDLAVVFEVYGAVQQHFSEEIAAEFEDLELEAPPAVKKAAAKKAAAKKATSRKPAARRAASAQR
ncbi:hypothetical protein ACFU0X_10260 [Streptomyces cellulosae]|uniref:Tail assembly chaperone n=1 Tax=Streptomyces cellulosae TaxID=1968 RepID=A0ABW6JDJ2_STRCE